MLCWVEGAEGWDEVGSEGLIASNVYLGKWIEAAKIYGNFGTYLSFEYEIWDGISICIALNGSAFGNSSVV